MKKPQSIENITVTIDSFSHDGRGIATIDGKTTFVSGVLPGETVSCAITKRNARYNEARAMHILHPAANRVTPPCSHFGICGGCSMQHMDMNTQIQFKQSVLADHLQHFGKVVPLHWLSPLSGNSLSYRRKARLGVRYVRKKEKIIVGFREKHSNFLTDIQHCPVLHEKIGAHLPALGLLIKQLVTFDSIPQIEVAVSDQETALVFRHLTPMPQNDIDILCEFAALHNMHFYLQPGSPNSIQKIWPKNSAEKLSYFLSDYHLEMQFNPLDFIQVNREVNELLLKQALQLLDLQTTDVVLDLFCGLGNFTLPIAQSANHVIGVEGSVEMVNRAQDNARHNHIANTTFYAANLTDPPLDAEWMKKKYTKILLDPPRTGAKEILPFFSSFNPEKIVYVSCNTATLARDAGELRYTYGYNLKQVGVVNMFPHTSHIEAIALFEK